MMPDAVPWTHPCGRPRDRFEWSVATTGVREGAAGHLREDETSVRHPNAPVTPAREESDESPCHE